MQALAHGLPSEAALVRQPSVAAAVHQALPDMPAPPLMDPLSNTSSESRDLPEGVLLCNSSKGLPGACQALSEAYQGLGLIPKSVQKQEHSLMRLPGVETDARINSSSADYLTC